MKQRQVFLLLKNKVISMRKITFGLSVLFLTLLASCSSSQSLTPKTLEGYVLDFFIDKSYERDQSDKRTYYFYRFLENHHYDVQTNNADDDEKTGTYHYSVIGPRKAKLTFEYQTKNSNKKLNYVYVLQFESNKSGTWSSPKSNVMPGERGGTFVILKAGTDNL